MSELDHATLDLVLRAMREACAEFMFLVDEDNRKQLAHATGQLEEAASQMLDYELAGAFSDMRHEYLGMCADDVPHNWKMQAPVWSTVAGHFVQYAACVRCGKKAKRDDIPVWQTIVKDED